MSMAYCEFGLANPGLYQVMFANPLPLPEPATLDQIPGRAAFQARRDAVAAHLGGEPSSPEAFRIALLIWQQLHGTVSLRISRPQFPWPPLEADSDRRGQPPSRRAAPVGATSVVTVTLGVRCPPAGTARRRLRYLGTRPARVGR